MAERLFTTELGFRVELEDGTAVDLIPSNGAPGGTTETDAAGVGSLALDYTTGQQFMKVTAGAGTDKWEIMATQAYVDAMAGGPSWREPARVRDATAYADLTAAETALNTGTVDGVAVADGDRVLLSDLVSGAQNVYFVNGTPGAGATYVVDTNDETSGDTVYIQEGTDAGKTYTYNGTMWVQSGQSSEDELGFIRAFIGKDAAGSELPDYTSNNYIVDGDSLETAIGKLDAQVAVNAGGISANQAANVATQNELDVTQAGAGLNTDGTYPVPSGSNFIDASTSIQDAVLTLDQAIVDNAGDGQVENAASGNAYTTIDTLPAATTLAASWLVHIREGTDVLVWEVNATHDGGVNNLPAATDVDFTKFAKLRLGNIAGGNVRVVLQGTDMALQVKDNGGNAVVNAKRLLVAEP